MSELDQLKSNDKNSKADAEELRKFDETKCSSSDEESYSDHNEQITYMENCISDDPYNYENHIEVINLYEKTADLNSLREAYKRFHLHFPLTPTIWLKWINTEINLATSGEQKTNVLKLFDAATEDYLSVDLWIEYIKYSLTFNDIEITRRISERALNSVGLVCDKGSIIWDSVREIENTQLYLISDKTGDNWKKQVKRLADIFKRQLSVPLLEMDSTFDEWKNWSDSIPDGIIDPNSITYGYANALKLLKIYKEYEDQIIVCKTNEELYRIYKEYIENVEDPSTVFCLFERAALYLCLVPDFWIDYCNYATKFDDRFLLVCEKAVRNCTWDERLWIIKLRAMEKLKKTENEILQCFEYAMVCLASSPNLELWLAYLDYAYRNVKSPEKIDKLFNQAIEHVPLDSDPQRKLCRFYARILAAKGDMKIARRIWRKYILDSDLTEGRQINWWLEYINLEKQYNNNDSPAGLRSIFQKAVTVAEDKQHILNEWFMYEQQFGTVDDIIMCTQKCIEVNLQFYRTKLPTAS